MKRFNAWNTGVLTAAVLLALGGPSATATPPKGGGHGSDAASILNGIGEILGGGSTGHDHHPNSYHPNPYHPNPYHPEHYPPQHYPNPQFVPQPTYVYPQPQYVSPQSVPAAPLPQTNVVPLPNRPQAPAPVVAVKPVPNVVPRRPILSLTAADLANMINQTRTRNGAILGQLGQQVRDAAVNALAQVPGYDAMSAGQRQSIIDAVGNGDPSRVRGLLTPAQAASPAGQRLIKAADAQRGLNDLQVRVNNGTASRADFATVRGALQGVLPPGAMQGVNNNLGALANNSQLIGMLNTARPGLNPVPPGNRVPIVLVPGLPAGVVIPLGNGRVLVGTGRPGRGILVGIGNVMVAAGVPAAIGLPVPDTSGPPAGVGILLVNAATAAVNYNLNQQPFSMNPSYSQNLPAGQSWTVEFDRGGGKGLARYQLTDGVYKFTAVDGGWELFKQSYKATLDNAANTFTFNYVLDNKPQTLAAGQSQQLAGAYPPVVRFDDGAGKERQKKLESGTYQVVVGADNSVDLYPAAAVSIPAPAPDPTASLPGGKDGDADRLPAGFTLFDPLAAPDDGKPSGLSTVDDSGPKSIDLFGEPAAKPVP